MKVRKFRILRLRHHVSMVELGRACGVSAQRISELELSENKPSAETVQKIQSGFESIIAQNGFERILTERMEDAERLHLEYQRCRNALMQRVGEDEYEL